MPPTPAPVPQSADPAKSPARSRPHSSLSPTPRFDAARWSRSYPHPSRVRAQSSPLDEIQPPSPTRTSQSPRSKARPPRAARPSLPWLPLRLFRATLPPPARARSCLCSTPPGRGPISGAISRAVITFSCNAETIASSGEPMSATNVDPAVNKLNTCAGRGAVKVTMASARAMVPA